jgi:dihydropteroate synthase
MAWFHSRASKSVKSDFLRPAGLPSQLATLERTAVMGVLNVTPDSFSDGGQYAQTDAAIARGLELVAQGADIVDIGGESTRPGAARVTLEEELSRTIPVVVALSEQGVAVSIDTMRAEVAEAAVEAGAVIVNDVSGGKADPKMCTYLATVDVPYIVMHWRGHSTEMDALARYTDVASEVRQELDDQAFDVSHAGVASNRIVLDPGIGFAKTSEQNWSLLAQLDTLQDLGYPVLVGASRKKFLGELLAAEGSARPVDQREHATSALTTFLATVKVWAVRVHDVRAARDAIEVVQKLQESR